MGLDMYLYKAKKVHGVTPKDISILSDYFDYLERPEKYAESTFEDWSGHSEDEVRKDLIDMYKAEFSQVYCYWDTNHEYGGYKSLFKNIGYWRKANQIHKWFVDNVQDNVDDCGIYEISKEQLETLLETVRVCLTNPTRSDTLLPTTSGCFFGGTDYDDYYFDELKETENILEEVLADTKFDTELVVYHSSW